MPPAFRPRALALLMVLATACGPGSDEEARLVVSEVRGTPTEAGGKATFTVALSRAPSGRIVVGVRTTNPSEGTAQPDSLTFDREDWSTAREVTVTGVDDAIRDGDVAYDVELAVLSAVDPNFEGIEPRRVPLWTADDETQGFVVTRDGEATTEAGGLARIFLHLRTRPSADVTLFASSTDEDEGVLSKAMLVFTPKNWEVPQELVVHGVDDDYDDEDRPYAVQFLPSFSLDPFYAGLLVESVTFINRDNDTARWIVRMPGPTDVFGRPATAEFRLESKPRAEVTLTVGHVERVRVVGSGTITITPDNWNQYHAIEVAGLWSDQPDNDRYSIWFRTSQSEDPSYEGLQLGVMQAERRAARKTVLEMTHRGQWNDLGVHNTWDQGTFIGATTDRLYRSYFTFDISTVDRQIRKAQLETQIAAVTSNTPRGVRISDVRSTSSDLHAASSGGSLNVFMDLAEGSRYADATTAGPAGQTLLIDLSASAVELINQTRSTDFSVGLFCANCSAGSLSGIYFSQSSSSPKQRLILYDLPEE